MKIRVSFVTNSSSSSFLITGMDKLVKLTRKELRVLSQKMKPGEREGFIEDCLFLQGTGREHLRSGDDSRVAIDLGDKQFWRLSYGFWIDTEKAIKILRQIGVCVTEGSGKDIQRRIEDGELGKLEALVTYGLTQRDLEIIRREYEDPDRVCDE